jgi:IclR family KDG regulon transcriptional repressor
VDNNSKTLIKGLKLLEFVASRKQPASTTEISKEIGLSRTTTYRLLSTLESEGYLQRDPGGRFSLGLAVAKLQEKRRDRLGLVETARLPLQALCDETGETAVLAQLMGNEIMDIAKIESPRSVRIHARIGSLIPAHCTATGKAILAYLPENKIQALYSAAALSTCTENSVRDLDTLIKNLAVIRGQGYAVEENEYEIGMKCIAAPIFSEDNEVIAAIGIAGLTFRIDERNTSEIVKAVVEQALTVSTSLKMSSL